MSEVVSFRLSGTNPREAQALEALRAWRAKGYSTRHIITEALLNLDESKTEAKIAKNDELTETLNQVDHVLRQIVSGDNLSESRPRKSLAHAGLSDSFVASVKKSVKSGLKID